MLGHVIEGVSGEVIDVMEQCFHLRWRTRRKREDIEAEQQEAAARALTNGNALNAPALAVNIVAAEDRPTEDGLDNVTLGTSEVDDDDQYVQHLVLD